MSDSDQHWWTDFSETEPGTTPNNWVSAFSDDLQATVETMADGHKMCLRKTGSGKDGIVWTNPGTDLKDVEILVEWTSVSPSDLTNRLMCAVHVNRASGTAYLGGHGQETKHRLTMYDPSFSELAATANDGFPAGTRIRQRFRVNNDQLYLRVWAAGQREPTWYWEVPDTALETSGEVGLFTWGSDHGATDIAVDRVAVAAAGAEASVHDPAAPWNQAHESISFPFAADRPVSFVDGWDESRDSDDRIHRATDVYAEVGTPVYAVAAGKVRYWMPGVTHAMTPGDGGGYQIHIDTDDDAHRHVYAHFGPDESGHADAAFAPHPEYDRTIEPGDYVEQGQHIGWLGESGTTASGPHLHFEDRSLQAHLSDPYGSHDPDDFGYQAGPRWNPYSSLRSALRWEAYPTESDADDWRTI